jgi:outer membrane cobalamin receptor
MAPVPFPRPAALLSLAAALSLAACHPAASGARRSPRDRHLITAADIAGWNATNAWDVLRRSGAMLSFREGPNGEPARLQTRRGRSSVQLRTSDTPLVIYDGARLVDFRALRSIPANSIMTIRILNGIEGTQYQGTGAGGGVIIIESKGGASPHRAAAY